MKKFKEIKNKTLKFNIMILLSLIFTFSFLLNVNINSNYSYALEKPDYVDWMRDLYEYDETVTDEEILNKRGLEDEYGRVFYKNPNTLQYDAFTGKSEIIARIVGMIVGFNTNTRSVNIDLSNIEFRNPTNIVYYNQKDYKGVMYGKTQTVAEDACGPTSLAMIVDSLTNANIGVLGMCDFAVSNGYNCEGNGTYRTLMSRGAQAFGLTVKQIGRNDAQGLAEELAKGHPAIALMGKGTFTDSGHYIVLTGIDQNGNVYVNDPYTRSLCRAHSIQTIINEAACSFWVYSTPAMN